MMLRTITSLDKRRLLPYALKKWTGNELASKELHTITVRVSRTCSISGNLVQHMLFWT